MLAVSKPTMVTSSTPTRSTLLAYRTVDFMNDLDPRVMEWFNVLFWTAAGGLYDHRLLLYHDPEILVRNVFYISIPFGKHGDVHGKGLIRQGPCFADLGR